MAREERNPGAGSQKPGANENQGDKKYPGRTVRATASSYSSVGGGEEHGHLVDTGQPGTVRPEDGEEGLDIPFTGEAASTRGAPFAENPDTGRTPEEEEEALLNESFEKRMRGHESG
jgi:hypothetical protein